MANAKRPFLNLLMGFFVLLLLGACQENTPTNGQSIGTGLVGFDPNMIENQRAACEQRGGRFGKGGLSGAFVCYEETRDANQICTTARDCDGLCLARSRTCSPVTPFFGCHEVIGSSGQRSTICIE